MRWTRFIVGLIIPLIEKKTNRLRLEAVTVRTSALQGSPSVTPVLWKELEHRKLGWKVLILKYDLGKGLSKEMM